MLASTSSKRINHAIWVDQSRLTLPKWRLRNPETSISANPIRWIRRTYYCTLTVNFSSTRVGYTSILSCRLLPCTMLTGFRSKRFAKVLSLAILVIIDRILSLESLVVFESFDRDLRYFSPKMGQRCYQRC